MQNNDSEPPIPNDPPPPPPIDPPEEGPPLIVEDDIPPPGPPPPNFHFKITKVSPIAAGLAGGITVTLTGRGFQPDAAVYFGFSVSPEVIFESDKVVHAQLPAAIQPGTVDVTLANPDATQAILEDGFTYIRTGQGDQAEVLGILPLTVLEDTPTEITIRGRNLIAAYNNGIVALRGPSRAHVTASNFTTGRDAETGFDTLTSTVRITATPSLQPSERMVIQVLASRRPAAASDGVFESSKQMFVVLPQTTPALLAYSDTLDPDRLTWLSWRAGIWKGARSTSARARGCIYKRATTVCSPP